MATKAQNYANRLSSPARPEPVEGSLSNGLPCEAFFLPPPVRRHYLRAYKAPSTTVEESLQISSFIQNKANFRKAQMNVNKVLTKDYGNISNCKLRENKANSKPNKANQSQFPRPTRRNKPNTNPIQTQTNPISKAKNAAAYDD